MKDKIEKLEAAARLRSKKVLTAKPPSTVMRPPGQSGHFPDLDEDQVRKLWPYREAVRAKEKLEKLVHEREHYITEIAQKHGRINGDLARRMLVNKAYLNVRAGKLQASPPDPMLFSTQIMSLSDFKAAARIDSLIGRLVKEIESQMRIIDHKFGPQAGALARKLLGPLGTVSEDLVKMH